MYEQLYQMLVEAREWMYDAPENFVHYVEGALTAIERIQKEETKGEEVA